MVAIFVFQLGKYLTPGFFLVQTELVFTICSTSYERAGGEEEFEMKLRAVSVMQLF